VQPALVSVSSWPWGSVSVDGKPVGDTPLLDLQVSPGTHELRIERPGFEPVERIVTVTAGQRVKLTGIALEERPK
jgi:PEGA domain